MASELNYKFKAPLPSKPTDDFASFEQAIKSPAVVSPRIGLKNVVNFGGESLLNTASFKDLMKARAMSTVEVDFSANAQVVQTESAL